MEELIDLVATDSPASDITDQIKSILYSKAAERIELVKPEIASLIFDYEDQENNEEE